ncbi:hypothetical protein Droror1_Dr00010342 [Drosera rotundifolia]
MAEVAATTAKNERQEVVQGIKLFGTTIVLKVKEEHNDHKDDHDPREDKRPDKIIPCPRCKSMETKFCYFNNYNVNQPRHFCRGCQRYWTAGGALRNVPVGAGRRKSKPLMIGRDRMATDGCSNLFDAAAASGLQQFDDHLNGVVVQEWLVEVEGDGFRHDFQAKRRRIHNDRIDHDL